MTEGERVKEIVVDPPINHVDTFQTAGGAAENLAAIEHQVAPFNQLYTHLAGEKAVLVIGGIVDAGRQNHHGGVIASGGAIERKTASRLSV